MKIELSRCLLNRSSIGNNTICITKTDSSLNLGLKEVDDEYDDSALLIMLPTNPLVACQWLNQTIS